MGSIGSFLSFRKTGATRPSRQVQTQNGIVEGFRLDIGSGKEVDLFLGIPFASPPIGELRFKAGHSVMVYVHGGGYLIDSAVKYGDKGIAKYLCRHNVVVVTIQYRLGLLGFFSTGDDVCPGNLGLWDMTMALQWVHDNIKAFGGNPNKVTVFGQSAGGASVDLLALSPHSRGTDCSAKKLLLSSKQTPLDLFQQVVPMAGNAECTWSTVNHSRLVDSCKEFARRRGWQGENYDTHSSEDMLDFLRHRKVKEFEKRLITAKGMDVSKIGLDLAPAIGTSPDDFLPKSIDELRAEAPKKRCLVGTCQHEGLLFATLSPGNFNMKGFEKLLSIVITPENHANYEELRKQARELYLSGVNLDDKLEVAKAYVKLYSDLFVNNGTYNYAEKMTQLGNRVYLYSFEYFNPQSFGILSIRMPFKGATHCTELTYLFGVSIIFGFQFTEADQRMIDLMTRMWTNFAKYGLFFKITSTYCQQKLCASNFRNPNGPYEDSTVLNFLWEPTSKADSTKYIILE
ncbi:unnamed protein product [Strongylus vulgaris]|uniref:Carboxylic ester hydrolase n=1 Tax=Strongylus vulgaris TaxID=40348 RepID=A0A3P7L564_STRVU|nr:unnamed protein product [Strongylus vulgaris]